MTLAELHNPNVVKIVRDHAGFALYFSRAPIPWCRSGSPSAYLANYYRHVGLYAYTAGYLKSYADTPSSTLEHLECLEQLRALWRGERIHADEATERPGRGVDTPDDLAAVETVLSNPP
jgi:3-deoxy-manno-octulosonate cytidylyltransferase (CMP-KDO synthetase)